MSQDFTSDTYSSGHNVSTDMQNIEDSLNALRSTMSGTSMPPNTEAGLQWFDTTNNLWKIRNDGNDGWLAVPAVSTGQKLWVYSNTAMEGWVIDSAITDAVIAVKGGANGYNVNGGTLAGTWTQPNHTHSMAHTHGGNTGASGGTLSWSNGYTGGNLYYNDNVDSPVKWNSVTSSVLRAILSLTGHTHTISSETGNVANSATAATYRPYAAVGTIQYPNM
ncbi:MAG: hypothetical protein A4E65_02323 [Syntrophorhabdus sp. PtaU1.Bin153]|nr:MAG: hypothetical protein A4E65_02323 [Syntrophorhabdus sp. PtaU1.Bin153]